MQTTASHDRLANWLLLFIALVSLIPRIYLGAINYVEYDGWWHVFIARQDTWQSFRWEYESNAHPPLYFLFLKAVCLLGSNRLIYRSISILSGAGSVFLIGLIVRKLSTHWATPLLAATIFAFSLNAVVIACEVRSYMLAVFFLLGAFYFYLDLLQPSASTRKSRLLFALFSIASVMTSYATIFFLVACVALPFVMAIVNQHFRRQWRIRTRLLSDLATMAPVFAVTAFFYFTHANKFRAPLSHVAAFYFDPANKETIAAFLKRNAQNLFNIFSPVETTSQRNFHIILLVLALATLIEVFRMSRGMPAGIRRVPLVMTLVLLGLVMTASVFGRYPFGGFLRQEFFLFPFLIASGCLFLDQLPRWPRWVLVITAFAGVGWSAYQAKMVYPISHSELYASSFEIYRSAFPDPEAVYVDRFNSIVFFLHHHDWKWHFVRNVPGPAMIQEYELRKGSKRMTVFRDNSQWNIDLLKREGYVSLATSMSAGPNQLVVFDLKQEIPDILYTPQVAEAQRQTMTRFAHQHGLELSKLASQGYNTFIAFEPATSLDVTLVNLYPARTENGKGFNVQADGQSALAASCKGEAKGATIVFDNQQLPTVSAHDECLVSAIVPKSLLSRPGKHSVYLQQGGARSNQKEFIVETTR